MGKISLVLPGNSFHANQLSEDMERMDGERAGLPVLRSRGLPVTAFCQGVDLLLKPWLADEMSISGSVEWGCAPFSHTLIPLFQGAWREEMRAENMSRGSVPVTFFGEFYVPKPEQIPTEFTLVLSGHSVLYSGITTGGGTITDIKVEKYPSETHAIRFGEKVGVLLRNEWFSSLLNAFFLFQRYPLKGTEPGGRDCLEEFVKAVEEIDRGPKERVVVVPLDMEAPWIGSHFGAQVWEILCAELSRRGLMHVFTPLSQHLERFAKEAIKTSRPHRELPKWTTYEVQLRRVVDLNMTEAMTSTQVMVKMIATGSDVFAAWGIKLGETKRLSTFDATTLQGEHVDRMITYCQGVIDVQNAAFRSLVCRTPFEHELEKLRSEDYFVRLNRAMAQQHNL